MQVYAKLKQSAIRLISVSYTEIYTLFLSYRAPDKKYNQPIEKVYFINYIVIIDAKYKTRRIIWKKYYWQLWHYYRGYFCSQHQLYGKQHCMSFIALGQLKPITRRGFHLTYTSFTDCDNKPDHYHHLTCLPPQRRHCHKPQW